uniref:TSA: Wollemia nobilis Ref_Wollemi_Transcript_9000_2152 transcribed RNA sequence n=1 Tax=Wollemia nobilis TaxID=56998 RepID=A0A0C9RNB3_9CONI
MAETSWDLWLEEALHKLESLKRLRSLRPLFPVSFEGRGVLSSLNVSSPLVVSDGNKEEEMLEEFETYESPGPWDRSAVEVEISEATFAQWTNNLCSTGEEICNFDIVLDHLLDARPQLFRKLLLFSGNDYLGLSAHPTVRSAAAKAAQEHGMGPKGSALVCGYTYHHRLLESTLADLKKKEDSLLCPTGFAANMAVMTALGSISSLLSLNGRPKNEEKIAIFSDALNHASIIDGIRLAERQREAESFVYRHCDMTHLDQLLSCCKLEKKVVVTDSLFSMDGDFAPLVELVELRKKHGFLLVIDDAHGTLVCGKDGGGVAEEFNVERYIDICIGTLSKAVGCQGGFIASSKKWKQLIQSRGRSFIFSTSLSVPAVAAAHAALLVAREEKWRQKAVWKRVEEFSSATGLHFSSPIIPLVIGDEEKALQASKQLLEAGFHVSAIRPPTVPANSCRLRITLSAAHTAADVKGLATAVAPWISSTNSVLKTYGLSVSSSGLSKHTQGTNSCEDQDGAVAGHGSKPCPMRLLCNNSKL